MYTEIESAAITTHRTDKSVEKRFKEHLSESSEYNECPFYKYLKETNHISQEGLNIVHLNKKSQKVPLLEALEINKFKKESNSVTFNEITKYKN